MVIGQPRSAAASTNNWCPWGPQRDGGENAYRKRLPTQGAGPNRRSGHRMSANGQKRTSLSDLEPERINQSIAKLTDIRRASLFGIHVNPLGVLGQRCFANVCHYEVLKS